MKNMSPIARLARTGEDLDKITADGEFRHLCFACTRTPEQKEKIDAVLQRYSFSPVEVWLRFERRAKKLSGKSCGAWYGKDFLYILACICDEG